MTIETELLALGAEIDAENALALGGIKLPNFSRGLDGALKRERKQRVKREREERGALEPKARKTGTSSPERKEPRAEKVRKAQRVDALMENWTPHARTLYVIRQECECCGEKVEYIAGDLIEYSQRDRVSGIATIRTRAFGKMDTRYMWEALPRRIIYSDERVHICPSCMRVDDIFANTLEGGKEPMQLPLLLESASDEPSTTSPAKLLVPAISL